MKKTISIVLMIGMFSFDIAIAQTAQNQAKPVLAVLKLKALDITENEAYQITNFLQSELLYSRRFTLVDRVQVDELLKEVKYQQSGSCDVTCAADLGKQLAASKVIKGSVGKLGNSYTIYIDMVDVETARIENSSNILERCQLDELPAFIRGLITNLLSPNPTGAPQLPQTKPKEEPRPALAKKPEAGASYQPQRPQTNLAMVDLQKQLSGYKSRRTWGWIITVPSIGWTGLAIALGILTSVSGDQKEKEAAPLGLLLVGGPTLISSFIGINMIVKGNKGIKRVEEAMKNSQFSFNINPAKKIFAVSYTFSF
jgi:hypothetical protein